MIATTTWKHNFSNYQNIDKINQSGHQSLAIFQPLASHKLRLQFCTLYDEKPLHISKLTIYSKDQPQTVITKNGQSDFSIEPRITDWSDWINFDLLGDAYLSIELDSPNQTIHTIGSTISNQLLKTSETDPTVAKYFFGICGLQVQTNQSYRRIAFFGDSLTNQGNFSAPLAYNLEKDFQIMTANYGISGNRLLHPGHSTSQWSTSFGEAGLTRFDHMLIDYQPHIVIFMEGINDLLHPGTGTPMNELPSKSAVITAIKLLKEKCRQQNIKFIPMTITPAQGNINADVQAWSPTKEALRKAINQEILTMPHAIDLASLTSHDNRLKPEFDCGDHVHFSTAGGKLVAKYVQQQLIRQKMI